MKKRKQTTWGPMFGIVNALGVPWTPIAFWSADEGRDYLKKRAIAMPSLSLGRHRVVPVSVTVRVRTSRK